MKTILLKVISPNEIIFDGPITMVTVRTVTGDRGILPDHAPLVSLLGVGSMRIYTESKKVIEYNISNGLLIVERKLVKILSDNIIKV